MPTCVGFTRLKQMKVGDSALDVLRQERILSMKHRSKQESNVFNNFFRGRKGNKELFSSNMERSYSQEELLSIVIAKLAGDSDFEKNGRCVFTVPASAKPDMLLSLNRAAISAGLDSVSFMLKPLAACYACGLPNSDEEARWLVVDFGRDSLEVSLAGVSRRSMRLIDSAFSDTIGGSLIDSIIVDECLLPHLRKNYRLSSSLFSNPEKVSLAKEALLHYAVKAKEEISSKEQIDILSQEDEFGDDDCGTPVELDLTLTKGQLEALEMPVFKRAVKFISAFLSKHSEGEDGVDKLILIGGASLSPLFKKLVREAVKDGSVAKQPDPVTVAARGASLFALKLEKDANDEQYQEWVATEKNLKKEMRFLEKANKECGGKYDGQLEVLHKSLEDLSADPDFNVADDLLKKIGDLYDQASYGKRLSAFVLYRKALFDQFNWIDQDRAHILIDEARNVIASINPDIDLLEEKCACILECERV